MTVSYVQAGTAATGGAGADPLNVTHNATVSAGEMAILIHESRNDNDGIPTGPGGSWTQIDTVTGGAGAWGSGTGNARTTAWYLECTGTEDGGTIAIDWDIGTSGGCSGGQVLYFSKSEATWVTPVAVSGTDSSDDASVSIACGSLDHAAGDMIIAATAFNDSGLGNGSQALVASGVTYGAITQRAGVEIGNGNQGQMFVDTASVTTGATAAPTYSSTLTIGAAAGSGLIIRLRDSAGGAPLELMGQCCT